MPVTKYRNHKSSHLGALLALKTPSSCLTPFTALWGPGAATPLGPGTLLCHCPILLAEFAPGTRVCLKEADFPNDSCAVELNLGEVG